VIGHGGLNTGVNEAVLLEVPGLDVKFRFTHPRTDSYEANAEALHERGGIEYPFQFLAWQLVELLHVLGVFLRLNTIGLRGPSVTQLIYHLLRLPASMLLARTPDRIAYVASSLSQDTTKRTIALDFAQSDGHRSGAL
jgi:hypothetical protein